MEYWEREYCVPKGTLFFFGFSINISSLKGQEEMTEDGSRKTEIRGR